MLADDVEMYHDKGGFVFKGAEAMTADYAVSCEARKQPDALVLAARAGGGQPAGRPGARPWRHPDRRAFVLRAQGRRSREKLVGRARFAQVWALGADGQWRLSRILSYGHGPAGK